MQKGFDEIKEMLVRYEARVRALEQTEASCQPIITNKIEGMNIRLADHDGLFKLMREEIQMIKSQVQELQSSNKLLKWFAGIVGTAVVVWLITNILSLVK